MSNGSLMRPASAAVSTIDYIWKKYSALLKHTELPTLCQEEGGGLSLDTQSEVCIEKWDLENPVDCCAVKFLK